MAKQDVIDENEDLIDDNEDLTDDNEDLLNLLEDIDNAVVLPCDLRDRVAEFFLLVFVQKAGHFLHI